LQNLTGFFFYNPVQRPQESRRVLSGDGSYNKAMESRWYEQAWFGPLPGYKRSLLYREGSHVQVSVSPEASRLSR
jgi:hypothetical protein